MLVAARQLHARAAVRRRVRVDAAEGLAPVVRHPVVRGGAVLVARHHHVARFRDRPRHVAQPVHGALERRALRRRHRLQRLLHLDPLLQDAPALRLVGREPLRVHADRLHRRHARPSHRVEPAALGAEGEQRLGHPVNLLLRQGPHPRLRRHRRDDAEEVLLDVAPVEGVADADAGAVLRCRRPHVAALRPQVRRELRQRLLLDELDRHVRRRVALRLEALEQIGALQQPLELLQALLEHVHALLDALHVLLHAGHLLQVLRVEEPERAAAHAARPLIGRPAAVARHHQVAQRLARGQRLALLEAVELDEARLRPEAAEHLRDRVAGPGVGDLRQALDLLAAGRVPRAEPDERGHGHAVAPDHPALELPVGRDEPLEDGKARLRVRELRPLHADAPDRLRLWRRAGAWRGLARARGTSDAHEGRPAVRTGDAIPIRERHAAAALRASFCGQSHDGPPVRVRPTLTSSSRLSWRCRRGST